MTNVFAKHALKRCYLILEKKGKDLIMKIIKATQKDEATVFAFLDLTIRHTYGKEEISLGDDDPKDEISFKMAYFKSILNEKNAAFYLLFDPFLIGTISYKKVEGDILSLSQGAYKNEVEIGSVYVHPSYQNKSYGKRLLIHVLHDLKAKNKRMFCLDCGYPKAQVIWTHLLGKPVIVDAHHFGKEKPLMIWHCDVD